MINHLQPIDMAMLKALWDGDQRQIYEFVDLPDKDLMLECLTRSHRVNVAIHAHEAYLKQKGGEKTI